VLLSIRPAHEGLDHPSSRTHALSRRVDADHHQPPVRNPGVGLAFGGRHAQGVGSAAAHLCRRPEEPRNLPQLPCGSLTVGPGREPCRRSDKRTVRHSDADLAEPPGVSERSALHEPEDTGAPALVRDEPLGKGVVVERPRQEEGRLAEATPREGHEIDLRPQRPRRLS